MMRSHFVAAVIAVIATTNAANAQTGLFGQMLKALAKPAGATTAGTANGSATAHTPSAALANVAPIAPVQATANDALILRAQNAPQAGADVRAAAPLIKKLVETAACAKGPSAFNALSRQMLSPRSYEDTIPDIFNIPRYGFKFHEQNTCLDIVRISDVNKPANNALAFMAYYVSPQSGEASHQYYVLQKDSDAGWLIRDIGPSSH